MKLIELESKRAKNLSETLSQLSEKAQVTGYLVGLIQDVKRCIEVNLKNDADNDSGDEKAISEIIEYLTGAENMVSMIMTSAIQRGSDR